MKELLECAVVGVLASVPAAIGTAAIYLACVLDAPLPVAAVDGARVAMTMLPTAAIFGLSAGVVAWSVGRRPRHFALGLLLAVVAAAGGAFGWWAAHGSPHVSSLYAAASGMLSWSAIGTLVLLGGRRESSARREGPRT